MRSDGGSFSDDCAPLNSPTYATSVLPPNICEPTAQGRLTKACLSSLALSLGYGKAGAVYLLLNSSNPLNATDREALMVLQKAGVSVPDSILGGGDIDVKSAGTLYKMILDTTYKGASSQIKEAARWFTVGSDAFDACDYAIGKPGPFETSCLQRAFRMAGCQASGAKNPSEKTAPLYSNMTWAEVNSKFTKLFSETKSGDADTQDKAMRECMGISNVRLPPKPCDLDFVVPPDFQQGTTWDSLNNMCESQGKRLCSASEMCPSNKPIEEVNTYFNGKDNWMAVRDKPNQWITYNTAGNRTCKVHDQVVPFLPAWGNSRDPVPFFRGAKCCPGRKCNAPYANPREEVSGWKYQGCFKDCSAGRGLPNYIGQVSSVEECVARAGSLGYNVSGNQYFGQCFAGNNKDWDRMGDAGCCEPLGGSCTQQIYVNSEVWTDTAVKGNWFMDPQNGARLTTIAVCDDQSVFGTNSGHGIWRKPNLNHNSGYSQMPGALVQIDAKSPSLVVGVNVGGQIYRWLGSDWQYIGERGRWVSIGSDGTIVCVNNENGSMWRYLGRPHAWEQLPGGATQIAVGNRNTMYHVNGGDRIYKWVNGSSWSEMPGLLTRIAVSSGGRVAGVNRQSNIFVYSNKIANWRHVPGRAIPGGASNVSISENHIAVTNGGQEIFYLKI